MGNPVLKIKNLSVSYSTKKGEVKALRNFNLSLPKKKTLGIVGESGSGKSTLAMAIMRYLDKNASLTGEIIYKKNSLLKMKTKDLRKIRGNEIAMVPQNPLSSLNPSMKIGKQVIETILTHRDISQKNAKIKTIELFQKVNLSDPELIIKKYPHQISGGQIQRVLIANALSCDPNLIILDEPTTALDVTIEAKILQLLKEIKDRIDTSIIYITHDLEVVNKITDELVVLYAGEILEKGSTGDIYNNPIHPYTWGLINCIPSLQEEKKLIPIEGRIPDLVKLPEGCIFEPRCHLREEECEIEKSCLEKVNDDQREISCLLNKNLLIKKLNMQAENRKTLEEKNPIQRSSVTKKSKLVEVNNLKKYFGKQSILKSLFKNSQIKAVDGVSFQIKENETFALVGESGCGKTTIGKCLAKLIDITSGHLEFKGRDYENIHEREKQFRKNVQIIFQNPASSLNPKKNIKKIVGRPLEVFNMVSSKEDKNRMVIELLESVELDRNYLDRKPAQLSGGEKQRVALAAAFATKPKFIICDEPVSAIDVSVQASILNLLLDLQNKFNTSYLFISHDIGVVKYISHRIGVMYLGNLVEIGSTKNIFEDSSHPYTEALLSVVPGSKFKEEIHLEGEVPSAQFPPSGCKFHTRCQHKIGDICENKIPGFSKMQKGHYIACHLFNES